MSQENPIINIEDRIPLVERNSFQRELFKLMIKNTEYLSKEDRRLAELQWDEMYARNISKIIDDVKNKEIRDLIMNGDYKNASELVMQLLIEDKRLAA